MSDFDSELEGADCQAYEDRNRKCRASSQERTTTKACTVDAQHVVAVLDIRKVLIGFRLQLIKMLE